MKRIADMLSADRVKDLSSVRKDDVLAELCGLLASAPEVTDPKAFLKAIKNRETAMSTGIGMGIAIPHAKIPSITGFVMAAGRSREGIDFDSLDGRPARIVILLGASDSQADEFLKLIAKIGALLNQPGFMDRFLAAGTSADMVRLLAEADG
jgi:mannitol/fructose-specific phosphotransferase system IIA component (Ntr-type)